MIPYGRQHIIQQDIDAVIDVLRSDWLTQGPAVPRFEKALADYCGADHALAMNSATSALHVACLTLGLGAGDWLWTTPVTFVASANCGLYCGARIDFVDIDPQTYNICIGALTQKLAVSKQNGTLPKVLVAVHLCGQSCDMTAIKALSDTYGFRVIEDASHAIGGKYKGKPVGGCQYSDITIFSFHPVKIITTAEGGALLTNDPALAQRAALLRSHGITRDAAQMTHDPDGPWYYQQIDLGFNYRMTDMQAALGVSQMDRIETYVARRHEIASRYNDLLKNLPVTLPHQTADSYSAYHLYPVCVAAEKRNAVFDHLRAGGIGVNLHYIPVHTQPYYARMGFAPDNFPESMIYYSRAISLPLYAQLTDVQQDTVVQVLQEALFK